MELSYATKIRRQLHMYPEVGFDLPRTLELLRCQLDGMGVEYTESYGKSSIVATVNPEKKDFTIGIRADTDALPIIERNDVPYKSRIEGQMHACGHDAHTAILLDTVRRINEMRDSINCRVKFLFQAAEEYTTSGAKLMAEDGVMDDIDCIVALHCDSSVKVGSVALKDGEQNAISHGFKLDFYGKSAHVANQEKGNDAIMMAVKAYNDMEFMIAKQFGARTPMILNVGAIHGGVTNNIIADHCNMFCTLRSWSDENARLAIEKIQRIAAAAAETSGGRYEYTVCKHYPIVVNNSVVCDRLRRAAAAVVGEDRILTHKRSMGGEDFSYFANIKPACMFRLGIRNEERGITGGLHNDNFDVDEAALAVGSDVFVRFILDNMNGIDF